MSTLRSIFLILTPSLRWQMLGVLLLMLLSAAAEMFSLGAIVPLLTVMIEPNSVTQLPIVGPWIHGLDAQVQRTLVCTGFLGGLLAATLTRVLLLFVSQAYGHRIGYTLTTTVYHKLLAQPYAWHTQHNSGEHIANLYRVNTFVGQNIEPVLMMFTAIVLGSGIFSLMLWAQPQVMLWLLGIVVTFYLLVVQGVKHVMNRNAELTNRLQTVAVRLLQESLGGIRDVILDSSQPMLEERFNTIERQTRRAYMQNNWMQQLPRMLLEFIGMSGIVLVAFVLVDDSGLNSVATLGFMALGCQKLLPLAQQVYYAWGHLRLGKPSREQVIEALALPSKTKPATLPSISFEKNIALKSVDYNYPGSEKKVLNQFSLEIPKGSCIGIVGKSGGGKSTLLDLLMGLLIPTQGTLEIDGIPLTEEILPAWRARIAHVPQNIFLLDATIWENIAFGVPEHSVDYQRLSRCIDAAQLREVITDLPNGINTLVGERGALFSGGQRQRIGIARALYRNSDVLILDEATSALDKNTEKSVMEEVNKFTGKITVIIVAHRTESLENCSKIISLQSENKP